MRDEKKGRLVYRPAAGSCVGIVPTEGSVLEQGSTETVRWLLKRAPEHWTSGEELVEWATER
eukprot:9941914-Karenia_brevis.AAC.1